jgi:hypothetical protein
MRTNHLRLPAPLLITLAVLIALAAGACSALGSNQPQVQVARPNRVTSAQGGFVLIMGSNFARGAAARVGSNNLNAVTWVNPHLLTAEVPAGMQPGQYDITVFNSASNANTLWQALQVQGAAPEATAAAATAQAPQPQTPRTATAPPAVTSTPLEVPIETATPSPAARATAPVPTAPPSDRPAPTQPPVKPTQAPPATKPPTQQPPPAQGGAVPNLAGTWSIVDTVQYGPGTGSSFPFTLSIRQNGSQISGSGDGLTLSGVISGDTVTVVYSQDNGSKGMFRWTVDPGGTVLQGSFDNSSGNGGASAGRRVGAQAVTFTSTGPSTAPPAGKGKKKDH